MHLASYEGSWCALYVKHKHEFSTARLLAENGHDVFAPSYTSRRRWSDRWKKIELPLFSGYVFWRIKNNGASVMMAPGVVRILGSANAPAIIPDKEIETIQLAVDSGCDIKPCQFVEIGSRVRINGGPLDGFEGTVDELRNEHLVVLSVGLVRSSVVVDAGKCVLVPMAEPTPSRASALLIHSAHA